jgi:hypothetical protein
MPEFLRNVFFFLTAFDIRGDSKLLSRFPWPINGSPDNDLESLCIMYCLDGRLLRETGVKADYPLPCSDKLLLRGISYQLSVISYRFPLIEECRNVEDGMK